MNFVFMRLNIIRSFTMVIFLNFGQIKGVLGHFLIEIFNRLVWDSFSLWLQMVKCAHQMILPTSNCGL